MSCHLAGLRLCPLCSYISVIELPAGNNANETSENTITRLYYTIFSISAVFDDGGLYYTNIVTGGGRATYIYTLHT